MELLLLLLLLQYVNCFILYSVLNSLWLFFLRTRANFVIGLWGC
jgi:hypothetical protein